MNLRSLLACSLLLLASACASRRIPGTEIPDTPDTRAIIQVMERYRSAVEARDAQTIQSLVSKDFRENAGTDTLEDDLTYENLPQHLAHLFSRVESPRVELNVRRVEVRDDDTASAIYYWNANWRMPGLDPRPQSDSELEQMVFRKEDGHWKILSGI